MKQHMGRFCACAAVFLAALLAGFPGVSALAEEEPAPDAALPEAPSYIYITIAEADGTLALAHAELPLQDADGDRALTVQDALLCAHNAYFEGGAAAGYAASETEGALSVRKLWGAGTEGYGCYVNHAAVSSLLDPVASGDLLYVFACEDPAAQRNTYCYFDASQASVAGEETLTLTLTAVENSAEGEPTVSPVVGAVIQIDGRDTAFSTDEKGKVTLQFDGSGTCVVSARKDGEALLPPVCTVAVSADGPAAGDRNAFFRWTVLSVAAFAGLTAALRWRIRRTRPL